MKSVHWLKLFGLTLGILCGVLPDPVLAQPDAQTIFKRWDKNGDGKLTRAELPEALRPRFQTVDADGDGFISPQEHATTLQRRRGQGQAPAAGAIPEEVRVERDLAYAGTDHARQRLDLYLPRDATAEKLPLVVFIHGGGWRNGDKSGAGRQVLPYVRTGEFAGASVGYRLSGDATWPAQIHDCKAAIRWLKAHADDYGIDADRIAVMGSSAGGHLVAMLGTSGDVPELAGDLGDADDIGTTVTCVVDYYGPANLLTMGDFPGKIDHNSPNSPESLMLGGAVQEHPDRAREASPQTHVTANDPPFLIIHGADDEVVPFDQSVQFDKTLRAAGVPSLLIRVEGGGHGGFGNPEIERRVELFLRRHLLGDEVEISDAPVSARATSR